MGGTGRGASRDATGVGSREGRQYEGMTTTIPISTQGRLAKRLGGALVALLALLLWLPPALPGFLDNVYYRGPISEHFDGHRLFNPGGQDRKSVVAGKRWCIRGDLGGGLL